MEFNTDRSEDNNERESESASEVVIVVEYDQGSTDFFICVQEDLFEDEAGETPEVKVMSNIVTCFPK